MADTNIIAALIDLITAGSGISALVGTRIYGGELPQSEAASMPRKAIVLKYAGLGFANIGRNDWVEHGSIRLDVWHYGENFFGADEVRRTVHPILKALGRKFQGTALIHSASPSSGPIQLRDPDTDWPIIIDSWSVLYAETAIS